MQTDTDFDPSPFPTPTTPSTLPCWGKVSQMGHRTCLGYVELAGDDERKPIEASINFASPGSLYGFGVLTEAEVLEHLLGSRPYRPMDRRRLADDAVEVAALPLGRDPRFEGDTYVLPIHIGDTPTVRTEIIDPELHARVRSDEDTTDPDSAPI